MQVSKYLTLENKKNLNRINFPNINQNNKINNEKIIRFTNESEIFYEDNNYFITNNTEKFLELCKTFIKIYTNTITTFALGSIFLPIPIAAIISGIITILSFFYTSNYKETLTKIVSPIMEFTGKIFSNIPFKYPLIISDKLKYSEILSTLDKLPLKIVNNLSIIEINNEINDKYDALGVVLDYQYRTPIYLHSNPYPLTTEYVLIHEIGHTVDIGFKLLPLNYKSSIFLLPKYPWGIKNFITSYAETTSREDFAESFAHFFLDPQKLKETSKYKYHIIKHIQKPNLLEKIFDNKFFRNIGKKISQFMSKFPVIRNILDIASFYSSYKTIENGIHEMINANKKQDKKIFLESKFKILSGILMSKKSILSLPLIPITFLTKKLLNSQKIKNNPNYAKIIDFIDKCLNLSLSFSIGPIGTTIYQTLQTKSDIKSKLLVMGSGLTITTISFILKLHFPQFMPILNFLENISTLAITEIIKNKISNNNQKLPDLQNI